MTRVPSFVSRLPVVFALAILLAVPGLTAPLFSDDVIQRAMLENRMPGLRWSPFELYDFIGAPGREAAVFRAHGFIPWFTQDDLRIRLFRPLSSALIALDAALFGEQIWAARLHSLAWFLGLLALVASIYRRLLPSVTAGLATLLFAIAGAHFMPVNWIAARHGLVASVFACLAFLCHVRAREQSWRLGKVLSALALAAGLLAGEMALGAVALILAWEFVGAKGRGRERAAAVVPVLVLSGAYFVFYLAANYGAHGSALYLSFDGGMTNVGIALRRLLILVAEMIAGTPSDAFGMAPTGVQIGAAVWGTAVAGAAWRVLRAASPYLDPREKRAVIWMAVAAVAAAVPGTLAPIGGRVLTIALVPGAGVVAILLWRGLEAFRHIPARTWRRRFVGAVLLLFACGGLIGGPLMRVGAGWWLGVLAKEQYAQASHLQLCNGLNVIVAASDPMVATYIPGIAFIEGRVSGRLHVLSMAAADHRIENVQRSGFDVVVLGDDLSRSPWEQLYRAAPFVAGTKVDLPSLTVAVVEVRAGAPTRLRFDFRAPLSPSHPCTFSWQDQRIRRMATPVPGRTFSVPYELGPMGW